jgi:arylsulfatase A-like enzyme
MYKSIMLKVISTLTLFLFSYSFSTGEITKINRGEPNFLIFIADDAGMDLGCYGNPFIKTPNIDKLAESGLMCENTFLTAPQCSPSRISILSGLF